MDKDTIIKQANEMASQGYRVDYIAQKLKVGRSFIYRNLDKSYKRPYVWRKNN